MQAPGAAVFIPPRPGQPIRALVDWWHYVPGANWRHPQGPGSSLAGRDHHPVVQVTLADAQAYARWAGGRLPTEAEWERAARAGTDSYYTWGEEPYPDGQHLANTWQGQFPISDSGDDGHTGTAAVGCFPANGFGLYDMAGNVWELTISPYTDHPDRQPAQPGFVVQKGGSYLCTPAFCGRFRPAARQAGDMHLGMSHTGFRLVSDRPAPER
jgi:formylglycine-generating enzyme required for sulfatase activity